MRGEIRTHYDNLKVARNAPDEVIRAAYRSLSQKYHPDVNKSPDAARVMKILNAAYEVLSDPEKRRSHDTWIAQQEGTPPRKGPAESFNQSSYTSTTSQPQPRISTRINMRNIVDHFRECWGWYVCAVILICGALAPKTPPPPGPKPYQAAPPAPVKPEYVRPATAPNGELWPVSAGYIQGYKPHHMKGRSTVTIDNSGNDSDVFVKLVSIDGEKAYPARTFYIPARDKFTLEKVSAGGYDVRYRDLDSGHLFRSEAFTLKETRTEEGVEYSKMRMTLYKVANGNMKSFDLGEEEF